jgi:Excalibur calcium-binding domain/Protein of unknown function (DUF1524)
MRSKFGDRLAVVGLIGLLALAACEQTVTAPHPAPTTTVPTTTLSTTTAPTASESATTAPTPGTLVALDLLALTSVENEHQGGYNRDLFPTEQATVSGCDVRAQVMTRDSQTPATFGSGCKVLTGSWTSPYDGVVTTEAATIDVDHVVALKEAWDSGAWSWDPARRAAFATDLTDTRTLRAVTATTNRSKGDRDPSNWMPPAKADECSYLADWISIKARWSLSMDQSEAGRIHNLVDGDCPGLTVARWAEVPAIVTTQSTAGPATTAASEAPYYANCTAARAAGVTPLLRGAPGYRPALDRDDDGIACE